MNRKELPKLPFELEVEFACFEKEWILLIARTREATFVAKWDGGSPIYQSIEAKPNIELT